MDSIYNNYKTYENTLKNTPENQRLTLLIKYINSLPNVTVKELNLKEKNAQVRYFDFQVYNRGDSVFTALRTCMHRVSENYKCASHISSK